jgi:plasmid maintenance system antidote protein VapI
MQQEKYRKMLQLKSQLENYVHGDQFEEQFNFSYFLKEYIRRQAMTDKNFALDIGVSDAAISQYINNRRKPTNEFMIRLELHSCGLFQALTWLKLLHKEKSFDKIIMSEINKIQTIPFPISISEFTTQRWTFEQDVERYADLVLR